jgi:hypothetical protein
VAAIRIDTALIAALRVASASTGPTRIAGVRSAVSASAGGIVDTDGIAVI